MRIDRRRTGWLWGLSLLAALATPITTIVGHTFKAVCGGEHAGVDRRGISTAVGVLLLVTATVMARPDRNPVAWLVKRPDRWALLRLVRHPRRAAVPGGPDPSATPGGGPGRRGGLDSLDDDRHRRRRRGGLLPGASASRPADRAGDAQPATRRGRDALPDHRADNAVDVILHLNGGRVGGCPHPSRRRSGHPRTLDRHRHRPQHRPRRLRTGDGDAGRGRFRQSRSRRGSGCTPPTAATTGWTAAKPYVDAEGNTNGLIAALRIIDEQVEAEQKLDRLARFDALTGLPNRAEAISRLDAALEGRGPGLMCGHSVLRRRPLQDDQRHPGARRGRRRALDPGVADQTGRPPGRHRRPDGW